MKIVSIKNHHGQKVSTIPNNTYVGSIQQARVRAYLLDLLDMLYFCDFRTLISGYGLLRLYDILTFI